MNAACDPLPLIPFVLDDDRQVLGAVATMLDSIGLGCQTFSDPVRFCAEADLTKCGCLILDLRMPVLGGLEVQADLRRRGLEVPVIFLSGHGDIPTALRAVRSGAVDFLEKPFRPQELLDRVNECLRRALRRPAPATRDKRLTPREADVARGIVAGKTSAEIAVDLGLSRRTVEMHRSRLLRRLNVRRTKEAMPLLAPLLKLSTETNNS